MPSAQHSACLCVWSASDVHSHCTGLQCSSALCHFALCILVFELILAFAVATRRRLVDSGACMVSKKQWSLCRRRLVDRPSAVPKRLPRPSPAASWGIADRGATPCSPLVFAWRHATSPAPRVSRSALAAREDAARACALRRGAQQAHVARPTRQPLARLFAAALHCRPSVVDHIVAFPAAFRTAALLDVPLARRC